MRRFISRYCLLILSAVLFPFSALAIPAITCHCFTDRSFDPARPTLADPYFLATTQNSFFSTVFSTDKKGIVMKKQQGTSSDDLWVAYWVASRGGIGTAESILQAKQGKETWQEVLSSLGVPEKKLGERFAAGLRNRASSARLAEAVVDDLLLQYRLYRESELTSLRKAGVNNQEAILAALLAVKTGQSAGRIFFQVKEGATSWGRQLTEAKINPGEIQRELAPLLSRGR